ncbi:MAG: hypothetical protein KKD18_04455 [Nanoarchaeota archaeon]|nr:hypothetical protein [Nanoarchaeota archaeon]MBU0977642.1 hypothetical protein [Nanoarchaeota archaeon]
MIIKKIGANEVFWVLRANDPKNPARVLDGIFEARGDKPRTRQYITCLQHAKEILAAMCSRGYAEAIPRVDSKGEQVRDSYGPVFDYCLTNLGMRAKLPYICWARSGGRKF